MIDKGKIYKNSSEFGLLSKANFIRNFMALDFLVGEGWEHVGELGLI